MVEERESQNIFHSKNKKNLTLNLRNIYIILLKQTFALIFGKLLKSGTLKPDAYYICYINNCLVLPKYHFHPDNNCSGKIN